MRDRENAAMREKHLGESTEPHKASTCSEARTQGSAPHISVRGGEEGEGREKRGERSDVTTPDMIGSMRSEGGVRQEREEDNMRALGEVAGRDMQRGRLLD